jgi:CelD/BcsL family acetyltransferase involved in cellulose biosynthesis
VKPPSTGLAGERSGVRIEEIRDLERFRALRGAWDQLVARQPEPTPFVSHDWLDAWWEAFAPGPVGMRLVLAWEGGTPVAAAPLVAHRRRLWSVPLCSVEGAANLHTPSYELLLPPDEEPDPFVAGLLDHLLSTHPSPDTLFFKDLPKGSACLGALERVAKRRGMKVGRENERLAPRVSVQGEWETYFRGLSKSFRSSLRRCRRRCSEAGAVFETITGADRARRILEEGLTLESRGWKGEGGTAILARADETAFYRGLVRRLEGTEILRQYTLRLGDRLICWDLCILDGGVCYAMKTAYDEEHALLGPGFAQQMVTLEDLFRAPNLTAYDMLPPPSSYKLRWSREGLEHVSLRLYADSPRGRLAYLLQGRLRLFLRRSPPLRSLKRRLLGE